MYLLSAQAGWMETVNTAEMMSSGFSETPCLKKQGRDISYLSWQLASTNVHMGKYTRTQAHKTIPTEQKENPQNGGNLANHVMMKTLYQKYIVKKEKNVKIGKGS